MTNLGKWKMLCAAVLLSVTAEIPALAQGFITVANFFGNNGANPSLVQGADGNFYGTRPNYPGTVFKLTLGGELTTLYTFCAQRNCTDGSNPAAGIVLATDGNFYGTTAYGGASSKCAGGCGTVFRITPSGRLTTLHRFCAQTNCIDGAIPVVSLVQGTDGNFYGTTAYGGSGSCYEHSQVGCGTVFRITRDGALTALHSFDRSKDGAHPRAALIQGTDGNFYGTTSYGVHAREESVTVTGGTVFTMTPTGRLTIFYNFCAQAGCADGEYPLGLIQATDRNFYGITEQGGSLYGECANFMGCGTIYKITGPGRLTTLHAFDDLDGNQPDALVQGTDENFYGATAGGGVQLSGTLFTITPEGNLTTLHNFCVPTTTRGTKDCTDGKDPEELFQATDGEFYGTTEFGGASGSGTVFSLGVELGPFVSFVRGAGKVGQVGGILGQGFIGTTSVSLNEIPTSFTVVSDTFIKATVPPGATTGYVTVTTPTGVLTSNMPFQVIP
jgi:uncharacterized repeat protein (TIGR03803 family)